jgi:hypothetical protein
LNAIKNLARHLFFSSPLFSDAIRYACYSCSTIWNTVLGTWMFAYYVFGKVSVHDSLHKQWQAVVGCFDHDQRMEPVRCNHLATSSFSGHSYTNEAKLRDYSLSLASRSNLLSLELTKIVAQTTFVHQKIYRHWNDNLWIPVSHRCKYRYMLKCVSDFHTSKRYPYRRESILKYSSRLPQYAPSQSRITSPRRSSPLHFGMKVDDAELPEGFVEGRHISAR